MSFVFFCYRIGPIFSGEKPLACDVGARRFLRLQVVAGIIGKPMQGQKNGLISFLENWQHYFKNGLFCAGRYYDISGFCSDLILEPLIYLQWLFANSECARRWSIMRIATVKWCFAASMICDGVVKSGSPRLKLIMSLPWLFNVTLQIWNSKRCRLGNILQSFCWS